MEQSLTSCYDPKHESNHPKLELAIFYNEKLEEGKYGIIPDDCFWSRVEITLDGEMYFTEEPFSSDITIEQALALTIKMLPVSLKRTIDRHEKDKVKP